VPQKSNLNRPAMLTLNFSYLLSLMITIICIQTASANAIYRPGKHTTTTITFANPTGTEVITTIWDSSPGTLLTLTSTSYNPGEGLTTIDSSPGPGHTSATPFPGEGTTTWDSSPGPVPSLTTTSPALPLPTALAEHWGQCGGTYWTGPTGECNI